MEGLLRFAKAQGLSEEEVQKALRLNSPLTDAGWVQGEDLGEGSVVIARQTMVHWVPMLRDNGDTSGSRRQRGCSEGSMGNALTPIPNGMPTMTPRSVAQSSMCATTKHSTCRFKLPRGDRRIVIHMDKWRLMSPATMIQPE